MADDEVLDSGLFGIQLADSDEETADVAAEKAARVGQSEEAFQAVKRSYRVKVENGEVC